MDWKNTLYFGDNLAILRDDVDTDSVDLIYLDPPFNSSATYNVLFKEKNDEESAAQIIAFEDTWQWGLGIGGGVQRNRHQRPAQSSHQNSFSLAGVPDGV